MKRLVLIPIFLASAFLFSCSKNLVDTLAPSKPEILFNQIKDDPQFKNYFDLVAASIKLVSKNVQSINLGDTTILQNKSLTYAEKSAKLNFSGDDKMSANYEGSVKLLTGLRAKYSLLDELTDEERKVFYKKAASYFLNSSKSN